MRTRISIPWLDIFINYSTRLFRSALYNFGEDSTIECLAVPKEKGYLFVCYFLTKVDKLEYYRNKEQWITALYDATYQELNFCKNKWYVRWSGVYKISQLIEFYEAADKVTQSFSLIRKGITNCYHFILFLLRIYFTAYASNPKHLSCSILYWWCDN